MGWPGGDQRPKAIVEQDGEASKLKELTMHTHQKSSDTVATIGLDIGKNTFHLVGLNERGAIAMRINVSRNQLGAGLPICRLALSAWRPALERHHRTARPRTLAQGAARGLKLTSRGAQPRSRASPRTMPPASLMTVPGIGPVIFSAGVAAIGTGSGFKQGRDFAAWLGLVPKQVGDGRTVCPAQPRDWVP
jgi:hypothetical protein